MKEMIFIITAASISFIRPSHSIRTPCVDTPTFPMNGRLEVSGTFTLTLTCHDPDDDLPLTAPGHYGVMMCREDAEELHLNNDFFNLRIPECVKKRLATKIALPITLRIAEREPRVKFLVKSDNTKSDEVENCGTIYDSLRTYIKKTVCILCYYEFDYCLLVNNDNNTADGMITIDMFFKVIAPYTVGEIGNNLLQEYTQRTLHILTNLAVQVLVVSPTTTFNWIADCNRTISSGVPLKLLAAPLCRGCPTSMYKPVATLDHCVNCPHGSTAPPFSAACVKCPDYMGDDIDLKTRCFSRE